MLKIAGKVLELTDDISREELLKIASDTEAPVYVGEAAVPTMEEREDIPDSSFAVIYYDLQSRKLRKYLLIDPGNVWLSAKYFLKSKDTWPEVAQAVIIRSILSRADKFGISNNSIFKELEDLLNTFKINGVWQKLPLNNVYNEQAYKKEERKQEIIKDQLSRSAHTKTASTANRVYALQPGDDIWVDKPTYDISTKDLLKQADRYFQDYHSSMSFKTKRVFAKSAKRRAQELDVTISPLISLYGSDLVNQKLAYNSIMNRARKCDDNFKKIAANLVTKIPNLNADELLFCLDEFDKQAFTRNKNPLGISDPFSSVLDESDGDSEVVYRDGFNTLTAGKLKKTVKTKEHDLSRVLDEKLVRSLKKQPVKAFKALPKPHQKIIAGLA